MACTKLLLLSALVVCQLWWISSVNSLHVTPKWAVSFCATRKTRLTSGTSLVPFDNVTVNDGSAFDLTTNKFVPPISGLYWLHFSVGMETGTPVRVNLQGSLRTPDIIRQHTKFSGTPITTSRDELVQLSPKEIPSGLWLSSDTSLYSDVYLQTSFGGFLLDTVMDPLVAFSVGRSTSMINQGTVRIPYDLIHIDTNNGWNSINNEYVAPVYGTYVITISFGVYPSDSLYTGLYVNSKILFRLLFNDVAHSGVDFISRSIVISMVAGDRLYSQFVTSNHSLYSDIRYQTSLKGFLYSPYRELPVSWSVLSPVFGEVYSVTGPVDPVAFTVVASNEGNGWDEFSNRFITPSDGTYYITITAGIIYSKAKMELIINGVPVINIHHEPISSTNNHCTLSRAVILRLVRYDELHIRVPAGYSLYGSDSSFSGFRIYA